TRRALTGPRRGSLPAAPSSEKRRGRGPPEWLLPLLRAAQGIRHEFVKLVTAEERACYGPARAQAGWTGVLVPDRQQRLQQLMRSFEEQAKKAAQIQAVMKDLRGTARSADGSVTVTVAPSGAVLGLQLSPGAVRKSHVALQTEIMQ